MTTQINIPTGYVIDNVNTETGEVTFVKLPANSFESISTIEDALAAVGTDMLTVVPSGGLEDNKLTVNNYALALIITEALNEGWTPNWSDADEMKYIPIFDLHSPGIITMSSITSSTTTAGFFSKLVFKSEAVANYAAATFADVYKKVLL